LQLRGNPGGAGEGEWRERERRERERRERERERARRERERGVPAQEQVPRVRGRRGGPVRPGKGRE